MNVLQEHGQVKGYVLINGNVITMDTLDSRKQAVAVEYGRIAGVGSNLDMKRYIENGWKTYDLAGKTVLPGFIDCHSHLDVSGIVQIYPFGGELSSIYAIIESLAKVVKDIPRGQFITMFGINAMNLEERRPPNRYELDQISTDHPVMIINFTGHQVYLNSYAVLKFGIMPTLDGVEVDNQGVTGVLRDPISVEIFMKAIANAPRKMIFKGVAKAVGLALANGVTTIHSMQGGMGLTNNTNMMMSFAKQLPVHLVLWEQSGEVGKILKLKLPRMGGCGEFQADGDIGSYTAALFEPYLNQQQSHGILNYSQAYWDELVMNAHHNHLQFAAHAEAEAGIEAVLSAIEKAQANDPRGDARHRIEHIELPTMNQLERMAKAGVIASVQPAFIPMSEEEVNDAYAAYGLIRMQRFNPLRSMYEKGVLLVGGSDSPVTPCDPLFAIHCAVNHPLRHEQLPVKEALKMFTVNAAYSAFEEKIKGTLEVGKLADMVVLSQSPYEVPKAKIYEFVKVDQVFVAGKLYQSNGIKSKQNGILDIVDKGK